MPPDAPTFPIWVLYTYRTVDDQAVCDAYGYLDESVAQAAGRKLQQQFASLGGTPLSFMVLPLQGPVS